MRDIKKLNYQQWFFKKAPMFFLYNVFMMILVLMHSVGYFNPFFTISINVIVLTAIILAVIMMRLPSTFVFVCTSLFWAIAAFFQLAHIDIWAERAGTYAFESFLVGSCVFLIEVLQQKIKTYSKKYKN
jgi:hypothetical protein